MQNLKQYIFQSFLPLQKHISNDVGVKHLVLRINLHIENRIFYCIYIFQDPDIVKYKYQIEGAKDVLFHKPWKKFRKACQTRKQHSAAKQGKNTGAMSQTWKNPLAETVLL